MFLSRKAAATPGPNYTAGTLDVLTAIAGGPGYL
jgi:hypothetical protein